MVRLLAGSKLRGADFLYRHAGRETVTLADTLVLVGRLRW